MSEMLVELGPSSCFVGSWDFGFKEGKEKLRTVEAEARPLASRRKHTVCSHRIAVLA